VATGPAGILPASSNLPARRRRPSLEEGVTFVP
jgi:hypothetical protein